MATPASHAQASLAGARYGLSERAAYNSLQDQPWDTIEKMMTNIWSPDNTNGLVHLGVAENTLLYKEVATHINNSSTIIPDHHLGYGVGPRGSPRLKKALVSFFNSEFRAHEPVLEKEILILPGVMALIDALAWSICNDGEGIIVPVPFYTGFKPATSTRARGVLVPASIQSVGKYQCLDDVFDPEINRKALEDALLRATQNGVKVRAVMLTKYEIPKLRKLFNLEPPLTHDAPVLITRWEDAM
ncbi:hypothetical protein CDD82_4307 [Ophiocordyceps australis]|uniref:Aminotransferase class I/classII large domain-containing protein n=1 Tax=Ophiocordyceps australis TaxID=1399860 RepID=A0A2C5Z9A1_9HYPO|nr:hypothetical protein CDD82_4307 [Ophiocordyceps australis]